MYLRDSEYFFSHIPPEINDNQLQVYLCMAAYIDVIGRPFWDNIKSSRDRLNTRANMTYCEHLAVHDIIMAGIEIGIDNALAILSGGATAPEDILDDAALIAELVKIVLEYRECEATHYN